MEILKYGNIKDDLWVGYCSVCGTIAECKENEIKHIEGGSYRNGYEDFSWEDCPFCNKTRKMIFYRKHTVSGKRIIEKVNM